MEPPYAFDPDTGMPLEGAERPPAPAAKDNEEHGTRWEPGTDLAVGPVLLRLAAPVVADAAVTGAADGIGLDYNRPPRIAPHLDAERVRLPNPPTRPPRQPFPTLMLIAPVVIGLVLVGVFRSYFYLVFVLFTPVMAIANWMVGRRGNRKQHEEQGGGTGCGWTPYSGRSTTRAGRNGRCAA